MDHPPADRSAMPAAVPAIAPPRAGLPIDAELGRFSPLTAPQREAVEGFCTEMRPWALRQARRSYRHLPAQLREQAVDRAMQELRSGAPSALDRRALTAELADLLTESLRHVHVGWCLNESSALLRHEGGAVADPHTPTRDGLAEFVDSGLGGLERAVLQLEIGAGRDSRTTRAALRLGPREYSRHRDEGLSKLRDAISARVIGRVCDQHVTPVVLAATGDRHAAASLQGGAGRCRACAREARGIRAVLNERLAIAPWPLVIKPAGVLAAKFGAVAAVFGGKSAGGVGGLSALGTGSGASAAATVVAAAALATGGVAMVGNGETPRERTHAHAGAVKSHRAAATTAAAATGKHVPAVFHSVRHTLRTQAKHRALVASAPASAKLHTRVTRKHTTTSVTKPQHAATTAPTPAATTVAAVPTSVVSDPVGTVKDTVGKTVTGVGTTVKGVNDTVKGVTNKLPPQVGQPLDQTLDGVQKTVDDLGKTVNGLLGNKP